MAQKKTEYDFSNLRDDTLKAGIAALTSLGKRQTEVLKVMKDEWLRRTDGGGSEHVSFAGIDAGEAPKAIMKSWTNAHTAHAFTITNTSSPEAKAQPKTCGCPARKRNHKPISVTWLRTMVGNSRPESYGRTAGRRPSPCVSNADS